MADFPVLAVDPEYQCPLGIIVHPGGFTSGYVNVSSSGRAHPVQLTRYFKSGGCACVDAERATVGAIYLTTFNDVQYWMFYVTECVHVSGCKLRVNPFHRLVPRPGPGRRYRGTLVVLGFAESGLVNAHDLVDTQIVDWMKQRRTLTSEGAAKTQTQGQTKARD